MKTDVPAIAEMTLRRPYASGQKDEIRIEIGHPYQNHEGIWRTPVALYGLDGRLPDICGEDSLQSLSLALEIVHRRLASILAQGDRLLDADDEQDFPIEAYFPKRSVDEKPAQPK